MTWKCMTHSRSPNNEELAGQRSRERRRRAEVASLVAAKRSDEDQQHHYDWGETTTLRRKWVIAQKAWRCYDALISSFLSCILPGLKVKEKRETISLFRCEGNAFDLLIHLQDVTEKRLSTLDWWSSCINTDEHPRSTVLLQNKHNLQIEFPLLTHEHETRWPEILRPTSLSLSLSLIGLHDDNIAHTVSCVCKKHERHTKLRTEWEDKQDQWEEKTVFTRMSSRQTDQRLSLGYSVSRLTRMTGSY